MGAYGGVPLFSTAGALACRDYAGPVEPEPVEDWCGHSSTWQGRDYPLLRDECDLCPRDEDAPDDEPEPPDLFTHVGCDLDAWRTGRETAPCRACALLAAAEHVGRGTAE